MFERIYGWLLGLYPSTFREQYGAEAFRLYQDRLRDETGLYLRCRLACDLLVDSISGLPQAWRNARSAVPAPSPALKVAGVPSFLMLKQEPLRPATILAGCTFSLTILTITSTLLSHPTQPLAASSRRLLSPVESVMNHVNQGVPPVTQDFDTTARNVSIVKERSTLSNFRQVDVGHPDSLPSQLKASERHLVVQAVASNVTATYWDREKAQQAGAMLLQHEKSGHYNAIVDGPTLAARVTKDLRNSTGDQHLIVEYSRNPLSAGLSTPSAAALEQSRQSVRQQNCNVETTQMISSSLGYMKLNSFPEPATCGPTVFAALESLESSNAIILDLRDNGGGFPDMTAAIASRLLDRPVPWYNPRQAPSSGLLAPAAASPLRHKQIFILTSSRTLSGAEQFTYNFKMLKRATIVGETTGGSAHVGRFHRIDDHFGMGIPENEITNPYGTADWEGTGVVPDVKVNAADALRVAEGLAAQARGR
jgi:Peptidase family S41/N-terminal domain of Peptidase_S41 in eukaryotic IRBP